MVIYILDVDNTITDLNGHTLYPHFVNWLKTIGERDQIYLATNQGGVGLRYWMGVHQFGDYTQYPTQEQVVSRITGIANEVSAIIQRPVMPFISFAYQSKKGMWNPLPGRAYFQAQPTQINYRGEWCQNWRKPNPSMMQSICSECVQRFNARDWSKYLVIGDMESDKMAAESANLPFCYVNEFFK